MGLPLLEGREFRDNDDQKAPSVAIVNQSFTDRYFPNSSPIGKKTLDHGPGQTAQHHRRRNQQQPHRRPHAESGPRNLSPSNTYSYLTVSSSSHVPVTPWVAVLLCPSESDAPCAAARREVRGWFLRTPENVELILPTPEAETPPSVETPIRIPGPFWCSARGVGPSLLQTQNAYFNPN